MTNMFHATGKKMVLDVIVLSSLRNSDKLMGISVKYLGLGVFGFTIGSPEARLGFIILFKVLQTILRVNLSVKQTVFLNCWENI